MWILIEYLFSNSVVLCIVVIPECFSLRQLVVILAVIKLDDEKEIVLLCDVAGCPGQRFSGIFQNKTTIGTMHCHSSTALGDNPV